MMDPSELSRLHMVAVSKHYRGFTDLQRSPKRSERVISAEQHVDDVQVETDEASVQAEPPRSEL